MLALAHREYTTSLQPSAILALRRSFAKNLPAAHHYLSNMGLQPNEKELMNSILSGYRVLDFGRYIAGPYCAALLCHMGAEVIRIERPGGNEDRFLTPVTEQGDGALFIQMNCNKLGMTLDLATPDGREIVKKLVATADVVVANLPPNTLNKLGLDLASLRAIKSDIILATNSTFGHKGPYANKVGFDGVAQAMSGAVRFSGQPGQPTRAAVNYIDFSSGLSSALGVVAALLNHEKTGQGQAVETSLLATALTLSNGMLIEQAVIEANREPTGNRSQLAAPSDIYTTQDGHITVMVVGPYMFKRWVTLMQESDGKIRDRAGQEKIDWLHDERFKDDLARGDHSQIISDHMAAWCSRRSNADALAELEAVKIPCGPVLNYQATLDHPYVQALDHLKLIDYPGAAKPVPVANTPFTLSDTPVGVEQRAPLVGEHTAQILGELGYSTEEVKKLDAAGVV